VPVVAVHDDPLFCVLSAVPFGRLANDTFACGIDASATTVAGLPVSAVNVVPFVDVYIPLPAVPT
jgi:hypothetical protein